MSMEKTIVILVQLPHIYTYTCVPERRSGRGNGIYDLTSTAITKSLLFICLVSFLSSMQPADFEEVRIGRIFPIRVAEALVRINIAFCQ